LDIDESAYAQIAPDGYNIWVNCLAVQRCDFILSADGLGELEMTNTRTCFGHLINQNIVVGIFWDA